MKIVIDIDEDVRTAISRMGLLRIPNEMQKKVDKAIQRGTPLDKLKEKKPYIMKQKLIQILQVECTKLLILSTNTGKERMNIGRYGNKNL